jgi:ferric-dicitrate binding protein FerR (iron transport regulator)
MNEPDEVPGQLQGLLDDYLAGLLDEDGFRELEALLRTSDARRHFVLYARLHTDLHLEARARQAGDLALSRIQQEQAPPPIRERGAWRPLVWAAAAGLLLTVGLGWRLLGGRPAAIAWLVNAQDCRWADGVDAAGNMLPGKVLTIKRGLAEVRFQSGASIVLEGPATVELLSGNSARLHRGKLSARTPGPAVGFEVLSPQGKVIDRGTEFGIAVGPGGATEVHVFEGRVEACPTGADGEPVSLTQDQSARIAEGRVTVHPPPDGMGHQFVRAIVAHSVTTPMVRRLDFRGASEAGLTDRGGLGTGLTHRLPGTGGLLPPNDPNLRLDTHKGLFELTTTKSDLNGPDELETGEYLGVRLADLGFTGKEDFAVTTTVLNIPALEFVGQFGLYAGARSDLAIRGGLIARREKGQYRQFLVNTRRAHDRDPNMVGLLSTGTDLRMTLKRAGGTYELTVENLTDGGTSTLTPVRHPDYLDDQGDLYVGLFGANTQSRVRATLSFKEFQVTVWGTSAPPAR